MASRVAARTCLVLSLAATLLLTSCGADPEPLDHTVETSDDFISAVALADEFVEAYPNWLDSMIDRPGPPLLCSTPATNGVARASTAQLEACLGFTLGTPSVTIKNTSDVPFSVWGNPSPPPFTVLPGATWTVSLPGVEFGQTPLSYEVNLPAALGASILDYTGSAALDEVAPGYEHRLCAMRPDEDCVRDSILDVIEEEAPERVRIQVRGKSFVVPAKTIVEAFGLADDNRELISATQERLSGAAEGTITLYANG